jgi:hypothetical protein
MALESITYDRARGFEEDLGPVEMKTWQPKTLMKRMREVDPQADADATLSYGEEHFPGEAPASMQILGTDNVLNLQVLEKHYDALGSYLHTPTLAQIANGKLHDLGKLRKRCEQIIEALETALRSNVWNSTLANYGEIACDACGALLRRRLSQNSSPRVVDCQSCSASYLMSEAEDQKVLFKPMQVLVNCPQADCGEAHYFWERDVICGNTWKCQGCGIQLTFTLGVTNTPPT